MATTVTRAAIIAFTYDNEAMTIDRLLRDHQDDESAVGIPVAEVLVDHPTAGLVGLAIEAKRRGEMMTIQTWASQGTWFLSAMIRRDGAPGMCLVADGPWRHGEKIGS